MGVFLVFVIASGVLFGAPATTRANDYNGDVPEIITQIKDTLTAIATGNIAADSALQHIKTFVLDPLVKMLMHALLQQMTASVINWINTGNGGSPNFVQNLGQYLLASSDLAAMQFFNEITGISNSPFANAIASSLEINYLQSTSAAGFWAANQCTLQQVSSDINGYLAGHFLQAGGWGAWFSLTTQPQNNPYTLYYRAQAELNSRINSTLGQGLSKLNWGQGFLSWCSPNSSDAIQTVTVTPEASPSGQSASATKGATNPGDSCINSDGYSGTIQTPGSVIAASINKALGAPQDEVVSAKELDDDVAAIFSALVSKVLSTGLSALSGGASSITDSLRNGNTLSTPSSTGGTVGSDISGNLQSSLASYQNQIFNYQASWSTIANAANAAASDVQAVIKCEAGGADPYGAQAALTSEINPVLAQAAQASTTAATASAQASALQSSINSASTTSALSAAASQLQAQLNMPPTATDVATAQQNASTLGGATSSSATSLIVSGGSTLDQMQLISKNAANALQACQSPLGIAL